MVNWVKYETCSAVVSLRANYSNGSLSTWCVQVFLDLTTEPVSLEPPLDLAYALVLAVFHSYQFPSYFSTYSWGLGPWLLSKISGGTVSTYRRVSWRHIPSTVTVSGG